VGVGVGDGAFAGDEPPLGDGDGDGVVDCATAAESANTAAIIKAV